MPDPIEPLPLDPEHGKEPELGIPEWEYIEAMKASLEDLSKRVGAPRKIKYDIDVPPACNETLLGLQAFRAGIPALRVCFRNGRWSGVAAWCRLTFARLWCRPVAAIDVARDWKTVRAYR